MTVRNLECLFRPASVAVIGASNRPRSIGHLVMRNLLTGGFTGPILPVNPKWETVAGVLAYPDIDHLPRVPDLAVICTPPQTVAGIVTDLGRLGTKAVIILTAGFETLEPESGGTEVRETILSASKPHLLRILGPNCVGLLVPNIGLNASFAHAAARPGKIAFVSQSGALATAVLDWANSRSIGFSHFISLGNCWDVDFGDVLDYLGGDPDTRAILLYMESVTGARKFMSAARAAARNKPVIVIKAGRYAEGAAAAASHTGALAGADGVYDAAIRRAGLLRVDTIEDLFNAAELLGRETRVKGERLAVLTNGGGAGVMAADAMGARCRKLAELSPQTIERLDAVLPANWSKGNPIDIIGDAPGERYAAAFDALAESDEVDAVLLIQAPTAVVPSAEIAEALLPKIKDYPLPVITSWLGGESAVEAKTLFARNGLPVFDSPEDAVGAFSQLVDFRRNQALLAETPPSLQQNHQPNRLAARTVIETALAEGRSMLSEPEAKAVLSCYGIPIVETRIVTDPKEALHAAREFGYPVALKILSDDISHKSDVGGVVLDIEDDGQLEAALTCMAARVSEIRPDAQVKGYTLQPMARRPKAFELIVGANLDPIFGPVVLFGQGGTAVEVISDRALGLLPVNLGLAKRLVEETRVSRLLKGYRDQEAVNLAEVYQSLVNLSQMVIDLPEIEELDINPLLADAAGVLALDARIRVARIESDGIARLAIRPYPKELEETQRLGDREILLRPIRPEDEPQHRVFLETMAPEDIYFRFFGMIRRFEHSQLARLTQIDFDREMAFIAVGQKAGGDCETLGVVRVVCDPDNVEAEFAIIVHSSCKGRGLGSRLLRKMIDYCRARGTQRIVGQVLANNTAMVALARSVGFTVKRGEDEETLEVRLDLTAGEVALKSAG